MDDFTQIAAGGILALLVIDKVFSFVKHQWGQKPKEPICVLGQNTRTGRQIDELHEWHKREDQDGVKVWYFRPSLERAIRELTSEVKRSNVISEKVFSKLEEMDAD